MNKEILLNNLNQIVAFVTLVDFVVLAFIILLFVLAKKSGVASFIKSFIYKYGLLLGFLMTISATLVSLVYSEYLGVLPCGLCWLQRVFIYSQAVLFTVAYLKNDAKVFVYSFWLSVCGLIIALYQEYLQLGFLEFIPCPAISSLMDADCAKPTFLEYGFVTFPFASVVLFSYLILAAVVLKYKR